MDKQRAFFYGFMVGFAFMIIPIPEILPWVGLGIEKVYSYLGFFLILFCAVPLIFNVFRIVFMGEEYKNNDNKLEL